MKKITVKPMYKVECYRGSEILIEEHGYMTFSKVQNYDEWMESVENDDDIEPIMEFVGRVSLPPCEMKRMSLILDRLCCENDERLEADKKEEIAEAHRQIAEAETEVKTKAKKKAKTTQNAKKKAKSKKKAKAKK